MSENPSEGYGMKVLSFGEILWDVYPDKKFLGGAPLNFAAHLAKHGADAYMLSAVGNDVLGEEAMAQIRQWGVFTDYITRCREKPTGKCIVTLDEKSIPSYFLLEDVAYDHISYKEVKDDFDVLYFGTLALRADANVRTLKRILSKNSFKEVFVDVNLRPCSYSKEKVVFAMESATILKISLEEIPILYEMFEIIDVTYSNFAKRLAQRYHRLRYIIVTLGENGAYVLDCNMQKEYDCDAINVEVKSTVGAGDSFSAAFLFQYLNGADILLCLEYAVKVAGYVVSKFEAVPDYCVENFLES